MPDKDTRASTRHTTGSIWKLAVGVVFGVTILAILVLAYTPPVSRDALTHHLALPKIYSEKGYFIELPDRVFSYYPMNLDILYLLPLWLGNDILAKYIHFLFGLLTCVLIYRYLKSRAGGGVGLFGALLFLSTPVVTKLSTTVYVDLGLTFFATAGLLSLFKWRTHGFRARHLSAAAIWCGLALGTKYHGLVVFFILTNFMLLMVTAGTRRDAGRMPRILKNAVVFVGLSLILFSPWMVRNIIWKSNPVYPLFNSAIQSMLGKPASPAKHFATVDSTEKKKTKRLNHFSYRALAFEESGLEIALVPLRIFYQGQDNNPKYFDGALNPLLLLLPPFAFMGRRRETRAEELNDKRSLLFFAVLYVFIIFLAVDMRIRYILPAAPPLAILAALGIRNLWAWTTDDQPKIRMYTAQVLICLLIAGFLFQNYRYLVGQYQTVRPWDYISGRVTREAYIARFRPAFTVHRFAGQHLPENARILGLFLGDRSYYSERELVFGEFLFRDTIRQAPDAAEVARLLAAQGITHLIVRYDLLDTWINDNFTAGEKMRTQNFFRTSAPLLMQGKGYGLHTLKPG